MHALRIACEPQRTGNPESPPGGRFSRIPLVLENAFPGTGIHHWKSLTDSRQQSAGDHLFTLLIEFLTERESA